MASLGEEFRAAREARKLSLSDVSEQVHIRTIYLQSIEDENWSAISAPVYVRGFLRTYARFLGLDAERIVEYYNGTLTHAEPLQTAVGTYKSEDFEEPRRASPLIWILGGVALLLVALVGLTYALAPKGTAVQTTAAAGAAAAPGAAGDPAASPGADGTATLSVHALANSWMRVVVDGKSAFEGIVPAGSDKTFHGRVATVRVGNAGGIEVAVNGKSLGTLGAPGSVVERSFPLTQDQNGSR
jgi:hypothetical protein